MIFWSYDHIFWVLWLLFIRSSGFGLMGLSHRKPKKWLITFACWSNVSSWKNFLRSTMKFVVKLFLQQFFIQTLSKSLFLVVSKPQNCLINIFKPMNVLRERDKWKCWKLRLPYKCHENSENSCDIAEWPVWTSPYLSLACLD